MIQKLSETKEKKPHEYPYHCEYSCPFWDSGQGYDHSSCSIPHCITFDCYAWRDYIFNPDDVLTEINRTFANINAIIRYEPRILQFREYLLPRLNKMKEKAINCGLYIDEINQLITFLENNPTVVVTENNSILL